MSLTRGPTHHFHSHWHRLLCHLSPQQIIQQLRHLQYHQAFLQIIFLRDLAFSLLQYHRNTHQSNLLKHLLNGQLCDHLRNHQYLHQLHVLSDLVPCRQECHQYNLQKGLLKLRLAPRQNTQQTYLLRGQPSQKPSEVPTISPTEEVCLATCDFLNVSLTASAPFSNGSVSITNEISTCSEEKEFPGATDTDQQTPFASIGPFCNESLDQACAVVNIDALLCSALDFNLPLVHVVAYSAFNESNVEQNYLGDGLFESFQILLEPQEKFFLIGFYSVVVSQDFLPCVFRVSVDVGQCTPSESPSEQPVSPTESPTTAPICEALPQTFTNTGETTNGRLERNDTIPSTCEGGPRPFPGTYGSDPRLFNIVGPFVNDNPNTRCATLIWDFGDCFVVADTPVGFNVLIHPSGKLGHR